MQIFFLLSTVLAEAHTFCCFLFLYNSKYVLSFILISSKTHEKLKWILYFSSIWVFPEIFLLLISNLISLWSVNILCIIEFFKIYWIMFYGLNIVYFGKCSMCTRKECVFSCTMQCSITVDCVKPVDNVVKSCIIGV